MAYKKPTWQELQGKKKKKRFIGPTKEGLKKGLATAEEGKLNTAGPAPMPGVGKRPDPHYLWESENYPTAAEQLPEEAKAPLPLQGIGSADELSVGLPGAILAQGQMAAQGLMPTTPQENTVRNIQLAYFKVTGKLAQPDQVFSLMQNPATAHLTMEEYTRLLEGARNMPASFDYGKVNVGLFYNEPRERRRDKMWRELTGRGPRPKYTYDVPLDREDRYAVEASASKMRNDMQVLARTAALGNPTIEDLYRSGDDRAEILSFANTLKQRITRRGGNADYDSSKPWQDPEFLKVALQYMVGPQFAYSQWGNDKDKANAEKVFEYARSLGYSDSDLEKAAKKLGVGMAGWTDQKTFGLLNDAMRHSDEDVVRKVVYDAWLFGRPTWESTAKARFRYAEKFGVGRLPLKEQAAYRVSSDTVNGLVAGYSERGMAAVRGVGKRIETIPVLGYLASPVGWVASNAMVLSSYPTQAIVSSLSTLYDLSYRIIPDLAEKDLTRAEYVKLVELGIEEKADVSLNVFSYHWGVLLAGSEWADAWEENWGRNFFTDYAETKSVEAYGYVTPWATDVGDITNIAVQFYLGEKYGDPLVAKGFKAGAKGAFYAGRYAERGIISGGRAGKTWWNTRYAASPQGGYWRIFGTETLEDGRKVARVGATAEEAVAVDASIAEPVRRLNDVGFRTHQSHGLPEDHPNGHDALAAEPYIEFKAADLVAHLSDEEGQSLLGSMHASAQKTGTKFETGKAQLEDGSYVPTVIIKGDKITEFVDDFLGNRTEKYGPVEVDFSILPDEARRRAEELGSNHREIERRLENYGEQDVDSGFADTADPDSPMTEDQFYQWLVDTVNTHGGLRRDPDTWPNDPSALTGKSRTSDAELHAATLHLTRPDAKLERLSGVVNKDAKPGISIDELVRLAVAEAGAGRFGIGDTIDSLMQWFDAYRRSLDARGIPIRKRPVFGDYGYPKRAKPGKALKETEKQKADRLEREQFEAGATAELTRIEEELSALSSSGRRASVQPDIPEAAPVGQQGGMFGVDEAPVELAVGKDKGGMFDTGEAEKPAWRKTKEEYYGTSTGDELAIRRAAHANHVHDAVLKGKKVPIEVLWQYRGNGWADKAIAEIQKGAVPEQMPGQTGMEDVKSWEQAPATSPDIDPSDTDPGYDREELAAIKRQQAIDYMAKTERDLENYGFVVRDGKVIDPEIEVPAGEKKLGTTKEARTASEAMGSLVGRKRQGEIDSMQKQYDRALERLRETEPSQPTSNVVPLRGDTDTNVGALTQEERIAALEKYAEFGNPDYDGFIATALDDARRFADGDRQSEAEHWTDLAERRAEELAEQSARQPNPIDALSEAAEGRGTHPPQGRTPGEAATLYQSVLHNRDSLAGLPDGDFLGLLRYADEIADQMEGDPSLAAVAARLRDDILEEVQRRTSPEAVQAYNSRMYSQLHDDGVLRGPRDWIAEEKALEELHALPIDDQTEVLALATKETRGLEPRPLEAALKLFKERGAGTTSDPLLDLVEEHSIHAEEATRATSAIHGFEAIAMQPRKVSSFSAEERAAIRVEAETRLRNATTQIEKDAAAKVIDRIDAIDGATTPAEPAWDPKAAQAAADAELDEEMFGARDEADLEREMNREPTDEELDRMDAEAAARRADEAKLEEAMRKAEEELGYKDTADLDPKKRLALHQAATRHLRDSTTPGPAATKGRTRTPEQIRESMGLPPKTPAETPQTAPTPAKAPEAATAVPGASREAGPHVGQRVAVTRRDPAGGGTETVGGTVTEEYVDPKTGRMVMRVRYDSRPGDPGLPEGQMVAPASELGPGELVQPGERVVFASAENYPNIPRPRREAPRPKPHEPKPEYAEESTRGMDAEQWALDQVELIDEAGYNEIPNIDDPDVVLDGVVRDAQRRAVKDMVAIHGEDAFGPNELGVLEPNDLAKVMQDAGHGDEFRARMNNHMADVLEERGYWGKLDDEVEKPGFIPVDDGTPFNEQRLNEAGFPVHEADDTSVTFRVGDLGTKGSLPFRYRMGSIREAAERAGAEVEDVREVVDGERTSYIKVKVGDDGDPRAFVEELMKIPFESTRRRWQPPPNVHPPEAFESDAPATPLRNWLFRTNAEAMTASEVKDASYIASLYDVPEDNAAACLIVKRIAASKNLDEVNLLLRQLESHGIEIDGGQAALFKNMRMMSYRSGMGRKGFIHNFYTPTTYGKTHHINGSTEMMFNVMVVSKLGKKRLDRQDWQRIRELRDMLWNESSGLKKRVAVKAIWDEMEQNIIDRYGSLDPLNDFVKRYHKMQGRAVVTGNRRSYFGVFGKDGRPTEGSRVTSPGRARHMVDRELEHAEEQLAHLSRGASSETKKKVAVAVADAKLKVRKVAKAADDFEELADKPTLTVAEKNRLDAAGRVLDDYAVPVPLKMGQAAKHVVHDYNPRIFAAFNGGKGSRFFSLYVDQMIAQPLMTIFKETVMSALGFPIKVNVGDEVIRLIPEGVLRRMKEAREDVTKAKAEGLWGDELDEQIVDNMAMDFVAQESGDWVMISPYENHPRYYEYLVQDLRSWSREPLVKRYIKDHGGVFPEDIGDLRAWMRGVASENSPLGRQMREFLEDTYRGAGGKIDEALFTEWAEDWATRLKTISEHQILRDGMSSGTFSVDELKRLSTDELWPVNAPENLHIGSPKNPLVMLNYANPFHYLYQGTWTRAIGMKRNLGSLQLLGAISNKVRSLMFADRYYLERKAILEKTPHLGDTPQGRLQIHEAAAEKALRYTNRVTYSRSSTVFEDLTRNFIPFGNAYRQFFLYWTATFAKHPVTMSLWVKNYQELQESLVGLVDQGSQAVGGPEIGVEDQFFSIGDYQAYLPAIPFFSVVDPEEKMDLKGLIKSNVPMAGFLVTTPMKTGMAALGIDAEQFAGVPGFEGLGSMSPFSRQAQLLYGVTGWTFWGGNTTLESLFGDPEKLEKAHVNAVLAQMRYKDGEMVRDMPAWYSIFESLGIARPEAIFAEVSKQVVPLPMSFKYKPAEVRNKADWTIDYYKAVESGDRIKAAQMRADNSWLDRYLAYYDASAEEQVTMKRDPKNKDLLKWWVSPYNYDQDGIPYEGLDWQSQFAGERRSYKTEEQYVASIHNQYVDIHGGTYMQSATRQGGTTYGGDANQEASLKRVRKKIDKALRWAQRIADYGAKTRGWDAEYLMFQFMNPDKYWGDPSETRGMWPTILSMNDKDPNEYNIVTLGQLYAAKYGIEYTAKDGKPQPSYKVNARYLSGPDALRALDMSKWITDPKLAKKFLSETPYADNIRTEKAKLKDTIVAAVMNSAANDEWYWIGSPQLTAVGIPASPKIDLIQNDLHTDYMNLKKLKAGTSEYKAARNAYYEKRSRMLGSVKGGKVLSGGLAQRLMALPFVLTPNVTTMGTGKNAALEQAKYERFIGTVRRELVKSAPNNQAIARAWEGMEGWEEYKPKQKNELARVAAWSFFLASAKSLRHDLLTHYSDYYDAPGESAASKYGKARVDDLNSTLKKLRRFSPRFSAQVDSWFGKDTNIGNRFLDWYNY